MCDVAEPSIEPLMVCKRVRIVLSEVRPLPQWAKYATPLTQEDADRVRAEVHDLGRSLHLKSSGLSDVVVEDPKDVTP